MGRIKIDYHSEIMLEQKVEFHELEKPSIGAEREGKMRFPLRFVMHISVNVTPWPLYSTPEKCGGNFPMEKLFYGVPKHV